MKTRSPQSAAQSKAPPWQRSAVTFFSSHSSDHLCVVGREISTLGLVGKRVGINEGNRSLAVAHQSSLLANCYGNGDSDNAARAMQLNRRCDVVADKTQLV